MWTVRKIKTLKNKINIFSWLMRQPGSLFSCSLLQYHDMTAKILHLQLSLTKHKVGMVKSPCSCAQFSQMWYELCQLLFAMTSILDIYSIISSILKGRLHSSTGKLCHFLQQWKRLLEISQVSFWGWKISEYLQSWKKKTLETSDNSTKLWGTVIGRKQPSL